MNKIKKFVKERDKMLCRCSVDELRKFVNNNADLYGLDFVEVFNLMNDEIAEATMYKMIYHCTNIPLNIRERAVKWLTEHNFSLEV